MPQQSTCFIKPSPSFWEGEQQGQFESRNKSLLLPSACRRGEEGCDVRPGSASLLFATHSAREQRVAFQGPHITLHIPLQCSWAAKKYLICHASFLALVTLARSSILLFLTRQAVPLQLGKRYYYNRSKIQTYVPARSQELCTSQILSAVHSKTAFSKTLQQSLVLSFSKLILDADLNWTCHSCSISLEEKNLCHNYLNLQDRRWLSFPAGQNHKFYSKILSSKQCIPHLLRTAYQKYLQIVLQLTHHTLPVHTPTVMAMPYRYPAGK